MPDHSGNRGEVPRWRANIVLIGFMLVAGFYLITEHRAHLLGFLPFGILLLCPLMHFFMHGGHKHGAGDGK
ncbi:DUF2933 domain-containing protein [Sphingopyxis sp. GW247-27LB]|uniref:DUF2933 domain-containing protein n=1 Tax=Sphingopyxis sp. GW247-27LB TaxID=2012632 RepID=UPI000BA76921|nr:DUF2933 domain-containing protein [Sphingopyxis sp. GW247-27LB]PAL19768.1 hypothetical protein CD928_20480 [Sphingopyxis sp. GW247-27LB]